MTRRSLRTSSGTSTPRASVVITPISKGSKRGRAIPVKSQYFEHAGDSKESRDAFLEASPTPSLDGDDEVSGYEDEDESEAEPTSAEEEEEDDYSEASPPPKKKQKRGVAVRSASKGTLATNGLSPATANASSNGKSELWREGVQTGLGHGTQVIIKKPKPRSAGKTPYEPHTIHPNTMLFLSELAENNDRQWLKMHDPDYRTSWKDFESFLECLQERLVDVDPTVPELPLKDIILRIYRDVRFSKDPTPYKTHFSAAWSRTGRKGPYAAYYVQIKPGGSFVGGGYWSPENEQIAKLRRDIDTRPEKIRRILLDPGLRKHFMGGIAANEPKAIQAFVKHNEGHALKTCPKGFPRDHNDIGLLRLKGFVLGTKVSDDEVTLDRISELLAALYPLVTYLNSVVMPDSAPAAHASSSSESSAGFSSSGEDEGNVSADSAVEEEPE